MLYKYKINVMDQKILVKTNRDLEANLFFPEATDTDLELLLFKRIILPLNVRLEDTRLTYKRRNINSHLLRQLACYFAGSASEKYNAVHGCGLVIDKKGIIFIGNHGAGKSTIRRRFGNDAKTLDDDLLMIDRQNMYVSGNYGSITIEEGGIKKLHYQREVGTVKNHYIHAVFLLEKREDGGVIKEYRNKIPRSFSVLDSLHPLLQEAYVKMEPLNIDAPIYTIGTKNCIDLTIRAIEKIISL